MECYAPRPGAHEYYLLQLATKLDELKAAGGEDREDGNSEAIKSIVKDKRHDRGLIS